MIRTKILLDISHQRITIGVFVTTGTSSWWYAVPVSQDQGLRTMPPKGRSLFETVSPSCKWELPEVYLKHLHFLTIVKSRMSPLAFHHSLRHSLATMPFLYTARYFGQNAGCLGPRVFPLRGFLPLTQTNTCAAEPVLWTQRDGHSNDGSCGW